MALSGMVMALMAGAGEVAAGEDTKAGMPTNRKYVKVKGRKYVELLIVTLSGDATSSKPCDHDVWPDTEKVTLNATDKDALEWWFRNECSADQDLRLCVYKGESLVNPFKSCASLITAGLDIGAAFPVKVGKREFLQCEAVDEGVYLEVLFTGNNLAKECPSKPPPDDPRNPRSRTHRLDVEIIR